MIIKNIIPITVDQFGTLLCCAVRYGLHRMTYVPDDLYRIIDEFYEDILPRDIGVLQKDIGEAIREAEKDNKFVGMEIHHDSWKKALKVLYNERD